ncbi:MAG: class I SAM-dependent methyltransferase [Acidimicrobiia bacterium]|nr:class I SAM-dependent methyltransferase [Acidimicrobiia bacterium]
MSSTIPTVDTCSACDARGLEVFHEQSGVPAHSVLLLPDRDAAVGYPRGDLRLAFCPACGFVTNAAFDVSLNEYSQRCEESQGFSPVFSAWLRRLAADLIDRYDLHGKDVLEIGCGKGEFLALVCELGGNRGVGIDPAYVPGRLETGAADRLTFVTELYSERFSHLTGDAVFHRHTLEHVQPVAEHVRTIRRSLGDRDEVLFFVEVPDTLRVLRDVAFWDVYYEHCSYFTPGSLTRLLRREGFQPLDLRLDYGDQYVLLDARPSAGPTLDGPPLPLEDDRDETARLVERFRDEYPRRVDELRGMVERVRSRGGRTVIWGAGSKGVAFLTTLDLRDEVELAVDVNPFKQGMFMAGTGQQVVAPSALASYRPDLVVAMNAVYRDEIARELAALGVDAELVAL